MGAQEAFIGLKESFSPEIERAATAMEQMASEGALGPISIRVVPGPDHYLLGEETGLLEVIEGRDPMPRILRPFAQGLYASSAGDNPTLVNNVETLANVPHILREGPEWLRRTGTAQSPGTMLFTVAGDVQREGVVELALGTPLRDLVEGFGGGVRDGRTLKAIVPGASNTVLLPSELDIPLDFESMRRMGTGLGSGGFAVYDERAPASSISLSSTRGSCTWSPAGSARPASSARGRSPRSSGRSRREGPKGTRSRSSWRGRAIAPTVQRCALPTGESLLMQSLVYTFGDEFRAHLDRPCDRSHTAAIPKIVDLDELAGRFSYDERFSRKRPDWSYADSEG